MEQILIIEDDRALSQGLRLALAREERTFVQAYTLQEGRAALAASTARYQVWSQDGAWCAQLTETPTEFGVDWRKPGEGYDGRLYNLQDWDGLETAITGLEWREDNTLLLTCETLEGTSRLVFDPEHTTLETA